MHNEYRLTPDKIKIKREMMPEYQLKIADLYNISIGNAKKHCITFLIKIECAALWNLQLYLKLGLKLK